MAEPVPPPSPGLRRAERRRWYTFGAAMLFMVLLAGVAVDAQNANSKGDRGIATGSQNSASIAAQQSALASQQAAIAIQAAKTNALAACIAKWSKLTSERSTVVSKYNLAKENAASALADVPQTSPRHPAALEAYRRTEAELTRILKQYPPPVYKCALPGPSVKLSPSPTSPSVPTPTVTQTVIVPAPTVRNAGPQVSTPSKGKKRGKGNGPVLSGPICGKKPIRSCVTHSLLAASHRKGHKK